VGRIETNKQTQLGPVYTKIDDCWNLASCQTAVGLRHIITLFTACLQRCMTLIQT